jgi:RNA polymerase sigma-54 factor
MGPAIALRLRQHLTLTPQVQQALRLLQMSALEFAQEMDQALASNPFLEEQGEMRTVPGESRETPRENASGGAEELVVPQEAASGGASERDQEEWSGVSEAQPTLREHLREQLMISPMGSRDRALAHMVIDSLEDDGYFRLPFDELAALVPPEHDVRPEDFLAALRLVQSLDPAGVAARTLEECLELQLFLLPESTPGRSCAAGTCSCSATANGRGCSTR